MRRNPVEDLFRSFLARPLEYGMGTKTPVMKLDVREQSDRFIVRAG